MEHFCYILYNTENNQTYNGYTNNLERRLKQHNGTLKGGARATSRCNSWEYLVIIGSQEFTKIKALSMEWSIRYPTNKRPRPKEYQGALGRLNSLPFVFNNPKFSSLPISMMVCKEYFEHLFDVCPNMDITML